jgi:hypothetical protein
MTRGRRVSRVALKEREMDYDDFHVRLAAANGACGLHVDCSEGEDDVQVPWTRPPESLVESVSRFRNVALGSGAPPVGPGRTGRPGGDAADRAAGLEELASVGRELSTLLFPSEIAILWHRSRARAAAAGRGLRLRIHADLRREAVAWFGTLPWELLYDDEYDQFLGLDARTPVVRYLDVRRPRPAFPSARPLRVLVIMPEPYGARRLDPARERKNLLEAWEADERVELVFPETATFDGVRAAMAPGPIHAIHFMGHGIFDEKTGSGGLVLEGPTGRETPILGADVGNLVTGVEPPPALAILNGCETGCAVAEGSGWPFAGATTALAEAGVPAIVAMQLPIGDDAAIHFSRILYRAIQRGHPVDGAVAEARLSLSQAFREPVWAVPALFMRVPDGKLFSGSADTEKESVQVEKDPVLGRVDVDEEFEEIKESSVEAVAVDLAGDGADESGPKRIKRKFGRIAGSDVYVAAVRRRK